jgi:ABC-2 type transport system permease protein
MRFYPYWKVLAASAREQATGGRQIIASILVSLFRVLLLAAIYKVVYHFGHSSLGYANTIWSLAVYFTFILNLGLRDLFKIVELGVRSGEVEVQLVKPLDWRLVKIAQTIGKNAYEFAVQLILMPVFVYIIVGPPNIQFWSARFLGTFVLLTIFAVINACLLFLTVGLAAFWVQDAKPVYRIFDKAIMVFGGAFVPMALLPSLVQTVVRFSPFGVYAAPTQIFNPSIAPVLNVYLVSTVFWSICLAVVSAWVWRMALRRIEVQGG